MEKKKYNKPQVNKTEVDCVITLVCDSANSTDCPSNDAPTQVPNEITYGTFINPFKWFK
jgi:hypothetical protein